MRRTMSTSRSGATSPSEETSEEANRAIPHLVGGNVVTIPTRPLGGLCVERTAVSNIIGEPFRWTS